MCQMKSMHCPFLLDFSQCKLRDLWKRMNEARPFQKVGHVKGTPFAVNRVGSQVTEGAINGKKVMNIKCSASQPNFPFSKVRLGRGCLRGR